MRQVASVIKDGTIRYFIADTAEGALAEFATIAVPEEFDVHAAVKLGFNLIAAVGLNGATNGHAANHRAGPAPVDVGARPELDPGKAWAGTASAVLYIKAHPGCVIDDMVRFFNVSAKAVASAVTRGTASHEIDRRNGKLYSRGGVTKAPRRPVEKRTKWDVTRAQVIDYIRAHPGCGTVDLATALLGSASKEHKQVIGNRILSIVDSARAHGGPKIVKTYRPNPTGGVELVEYRIEEEPDHAPAGVREPGLD